MSADEIKRLAKSHVLVTFCGENHLNGSPCTDCLDHKENTCQDKEAIKSALLAYAAMVERCEEMHDKFCMKFSINSDKAKTNPQFMKVAILLQDMFDYILSRGRRACADVRGAV